MASNDINTYGILAGDHVHLNFGTSKITGDLGSFNPIVGASAIVSGATNTGSSVNDALAYANFIYDIFFSYTPDTSSSASDIGGMTFNNGVNELTDTAVTIGGATPQVTLDGYGTYIFQIPNGGLTTDPTSAPVYFNLINGARASDVYWVINGDVNLQTITGNTTTFVGTVLCAGNITVETNSSSAGGLLAFSSSGIIELNQNVVVCRNSQSILDDFSTDYINIKTTLKDNQAIQINAADPNGGILLNSGSGGINLTAGLDGAIIERWSDTGSLIQYQSDESALATMDTSVTAEQLLVRIVTIEADVSATLALPSAADMFSAMNNISGIIPGIKIKDSIDFAIINTSVSNNLTITTTETTVGNLVISAESSALFRLRMTNVTTGSETYTLYRLS